MRYIATNNLRPGYKIASSLAFSKGTVLLRKGTVLTRSIIKRVALLGYQGLYIEDELSEGLEITDLIKQRFKDKDAKRIAAVVFQCGKQYDIQRKKAY